VTSNKHPLCRFVNDKNKVGASYVVATNAKKIEDEGGD
jgi:hypothetical protein